MMKKIHIAIFVVVVIVIVSIALMISQAKADNLAGEYGAIENSNLSLTVKKTAGGWNFEIKDLYDKTAIKGVFRKETGKDGEWLIPFSTGFDSPNFKGDSLRIWPGQRLIGPDGIIWVKK